MIDWLKGLLGSSSPNGTDDLTARPADDTVDNRPSAPEPRVRLDVRDTFTVEGVANVVLAEVAAGTLERGHALVHPESGERCVVDAIELHHEEVAEAEPGDVVGVAAEWESGSCPVERGDELRNDR